MNDNKLIHRIEKIFMGYVPVIGKKLAIEDEERLNEEVEFLKEIVQESKVQIMKLEDRMNAEYAASKEYKNFIRNTARRAVNDLRKDKALCEYYSKCCAKGEYGERIQSQVFILGYD